MATYADVIRRVIPQAPSWLCDHILWERTPFPMRPVKIRELMKAAVRWKIACEQGFKLCLFCDNKVKEDKLNCEKCGKELEKHRDE